MNRLNVRLSRSVVALGCVVSAGCASADIADEEGRIGQAELAEVYTCPVDVSDVKAQRELVITALDVVNDPCRTGWSPAACTNTNHLAKWTFGYLMQQMAGAGVNTSTFILKWLESFEEAQSVNGQTLAVRSNVRTYIIDPWRAVSKKPDGVTTCTPGVKVDAVDGACNLDLTKAPFRLLAIVNRTDLRLPGYGGGAGEGRFVFGFTKMDGSPLDATVILEYALPTSIAAPTWASKFHALRALGTGEKYNNALADITELFAKANASVASPNGSAISQVRTAEKSFDGNATAVFELREQRLQCRPNTSCTLNNKYLLPSTLVRTPRNSFDFSPTLTSYMNNNMSAILNGTHVVPASMLGISSRPNTMATNPFGAWAPDADLVSVPYPNTAGDVRRLFGLSTCNGCHSPEETNTNNFHIQPRSANQPSTLSAFLAGATTVTEPLEGRTIAYNEMQRRMCEHKWLYMGNLGVLTGTSGRPH